jgi:hypothetical protein
MKFFSKKKSNHELLIIELKKCNSELQITVGRCEYLNRICQFSGYQMIDFWENGKCLMNDFKIEDMAQLATLLRSWCELRFTGKEMEIAIPGFKASENMIQVTNDTESFILNNWIALKSADKDFAPIIELLMKREETKNLMAFRQLFDLVLTRYIGDWKGNYINDLPRIRITEKGNFKVMTRTQAFKRDMDFSETNPQHYLGVGNAEQAVEIIIKNLPAENIKAKFITDEDWINYRKGIV